MEANDSSENLKLSENEDRISSLPDPLIHHILSFLPSTEESIRTDILSKRWRNQWAHVPVLIFDSKSSGMISDTDFNRFIDNTLLLYECSKMKKFHIAYYFQEDSNFNSKLRFTTRKHVEVLCLDFCHSDDIDRYSLSNFIFDNASLVDLQISNCDFEISSKINWPSLKALKMENCSLGNRLSIDNVVSGCPSLESLEVVETYNFQRVIIIASKSLKVLILIDIEVEDHIEISCPNLEKLCLGNVNIEDKTIENVLSGSPLLNTLRLNSYPFPQLVIVSKSLKRLDLYRISEDCAIEISCPNLEILILKYFNIEKCKLMNLPSSCCATLDFKTHDRCPKILAKKTLEELKAFKEVIIRNCFVKILSAIEMNQPSYPLLNVKCLTIVHPDILSTFWEL